MVSGHWTHVGKRVHELEGADSWSGSGYKLLATDACTFWYFEDVCSLAGMAGPAAEGGHPPSRLDPLLATRKCA
jgi:hypothetical protein